MGGGDVIMGASIPQFSKEMQAEISPEAAPLWNFVCNHAPKIAAGVVSIVVICLAVAGWQWYVEKQLTEARGQLGRIISVQDPARRVSQLEAFASSAPSALTLSVQLELASSAAEMKDFAKAAAAYEKVAQLDSGTPLAFAARLNQGQILLQSGDAAAARAVFSALAAEAPANVKATLNLQSAEAALAAGDKAGAVAALEAATAALAPTDQEGRAYFRALIDKLQK
jgi:predicted negative regulator of RcsB-dependent stress response